METPSTTARLVERGDEHKKRSKASAPFCRFYLSVKKKTVCAIERAWSCELRTRPSNFASRRIRIAPNPHSVHSAAQARRPRVSPVRVAGRAWRRFDCRRRQSLRGPAAASNAFDARLARATRRLTAPTSVALALWSSDLVVQQSLWFDPQSSARQNELGTA